jgi:hypothetical protein
MLTKRVLAVGLTGVEGASSVPLIALGYPDRQIVWRGCQSPWPLVCVHRQRSR